MGIRTSFGLCFSALRGVAFAVLCVPCRKLIARKGFKGVQSRIPALLKSIMEEEASDWGSFLPHMPSRKNEFLFVRFSRAGVCSAGNTLAFRELQTTPFFDGSSKRSAFLTFFRDSTSAKGWNAFPFLIRHRMKSG